MASTLQKIAITGHTSGLGKSLFDHYRQKGCVVEGFSRSNGYDLFTLGTQDRILQRINDYDVLINNAYAGWSQIELLYLTFEKWKTQPKHIINISSNSGDGVKNFVHPYAAHKTALDKASEQLNAIKEAHCRVTNLRPGWLDTERVAKFNINEPKIALTEMIQIIDWILMLPKTLHISNLSVTARGS